MTKYQYLILGIILGVALGFIIGKNYGMRVQGEIDQIQQSSHRVEVIAARISLPEGTVLKRADLSVMSVPEAVVSNPIFLNDVDRIIGHKTLNRLDAGQSLHWADIEGQAGTDQ